MDLKDLTPKSNIVTVAITHPSSGEVLLNLDDTPMSVTIYAPHSKEYRAYSHTQTNARLKKAQETKVMDITSEELEQSTLDMLCNITKEWNLTYDNEMPELNLDKAKEVYTEIFWLKDLVEVGVGEAMDFTKL
jgi:hypothetical protein